MNNHQSANLTPIPSRAGQDHAKFARRERRRRVIRETLCELVAVGLVFALSAFASTQL